MASASGRPCSPAQGQARSSVLAVAGLYRQHLEFGHVCFSYLTGT